MAGLIVVAPTLIMTWAFGWWGVLVGLATGLIGWWWMGRAAGRRLEAQGVELLTLLRHGRGTTPSGRPRDPFSSLPKGKRLLVGLCLGLGALPLFPQGIVPMIFLITGTKTKVWFLAMYQPFPWNWVVASAMILLGLAMYGYAIGVYIVASKPTSPVSAAPNESREPAKIDQD